MQTVEAENRDDEIERDLASCAEGPSLLYVDMAYCLDELIDRKHFQFFEARHSGNYFSKVVGLHPMADRVTKLSAPVMRRSFSARQDVIEGSACALKLPRFLFPINLIISQWQLLNRVIRIVIDENLSFVAATDALYSGLFASWISRATGRPLIIHVVGHYEDLYRSTGSLMMPKLIPFYWLQKKIIRYVLKRADLVAAGSLKLGEYARQMGARADSIKHIRVTKNVGAQHRVPPSDRAPLEPILDRFGIPRDSRILITIARHHQVKLVDHAIRAMSAVVAAHPRSVLLLAGDGPERQRLENLVHELGLNDHVRFLGLLDQDTLTAIIPHAVVLSPLTGMALYETSLGGAPTIAYDFDPQVSELVEDGVTGYLVRHEDVGAMVGAAIRMLDSPRQASEMGKKIRERALEITDPKINQMIEHGALDELMRTFAWGSRVRGQRRFPLSHSAEFVPALDSTLGSTPHNEEAPHGPSR